MAGADALGAAGMLGARPTSLFRETDIDNGILMGIMGVPPSCAGLSLRTGHPFVVPVHRKAGNIISRVRFGLPTRAGRHRPNDLNPIVITTRDDQMAVHLPGIQQMLAGQQGLLGQRRMDLLRHFTIIGRCGSRDDQ